MNVDVKKSSIEHIMKNIEEVEKKLTNELEKLQEKKAKKLDERATLNSELKGLNANFKKIAKIYSNDATDLKRDDLLTTGNTLKETIKEIDKLTEELKDIEIAIDVINKSIDEFDNKVDFDIDKM